MNNLASELYDALAALDRPRVESLFLQAVSNSSPMQAVSALIHIAA